MRVNTRVLDYSKYIVVASESLCLYIICTQVHLHVDIYTKGSPTSLPVICTCTIMYDVHRYIVAPTSIVYVILCTSTV